MSKPNLGSLPESSHPERDAVHISVFQARSQYRIEPGTPVVIDKTYGFPYVREGLTDPIGIVDPWLSQPTPGGSFWVLASPRKTTEPRHMWSFYEETGGSTPSSEVDYDDGCRGCD